MGCAPELPGVQLTDLHIRRVLVGRCLPEVQIVVRAGLHGLHEGVGDQHGHVEHAQTRGVGLGGDEIFHIRVVATHGRHQRAAAGACGHDGAAHGVPDIHDRQRAGGIRRDAQHIRAARAAGVLPVGVVPPSENVEQSAPILLAAGAARAISDLREIEEVLP